MAKIKDSRKWLIVLISFYNHAFCVGPYFGMNVFYTSWVDDFGASRGLTSLTLAVGVASGFASGPVVSGLVSRFGHRKVVIAGSIIASAGLFASCFATSISTLILLVGVQGGIGVGMQYLPCIALIPYYFKSRRSLAMGIAGAGVGIGTFVYPPFLIWLEKLYTWRGCMIIVSGIALNMVVCGALLQPVASQLEKSIEESSAQKAQDSDLESVGADSLTESYSTGSESTQNSESTRVSSLTEEIKDTQVEMKPEKSILDEGKLLNTKYQLLNVHCKDSCGKMPLFNINTTENWILSPKRAPFIVEQDERKNSDILLSCNTKVDSTLSKLSHTQERFPLGKLNFWQQSIALQHKPQDISFSADVAENPNKESLPKANLNLKGFPTSLKPNHLKSVQACSDNESLNHFSKTILLNSTHNTKVFSREESEKQTSCCPTLPTCLARFISLMRNPYFVAFAMSNFLTCVAFFLAPVYMVDRAVDNGVEREQAALALSMLGAGNLFGRMITGWLADNIVDSLLLDAACLVLCGVFTCLSPLCGASLVLHGIYGFTFGFFTGGFMTLTPLILVDLMGLSLLSDSLGLLHLFRAAGLVAGTPIAGLMYDWSNTYTAAFILLGAVMALSGVVIVALKLVVVRFKHKAGSSAAGAEQVYVIDALNRCEETALSDSKSNGVTTTIMTRL